MGQRADYDPPGYEPEAMAPALRAILATEFSERFADKMRRRMIVSYHKYGAVAAGFPEKMDALESLRLRLAMYADTGNAEWLVDVANFAMIAYMHPADRRARFQGTDADASPGRATTTGHVVRHGNADPTVARLRQRYAAHQGD